MGELKVLHRIYFGFDGKPDLYQEYLETWKEQLPEYKIMHWNAENLPMDLNEYVTTHAKEKDAVFLSDYFRWWVLREYGGIYLDADIEIVNGKKFDQVVEELEQGQHHSFTGFADNGLPVYDWIAESVGSKKNSPLSVFMCSLYDNMGPLSYLDKHSIAAPNLLACYFAYHGCFIENNGKYSGDIDKIIDILGVRVYPKEYFQPVELYPYRLIEKLGINLYAPNITENTCLCHHASSSWLPEMHISHQKFRQMLEKRPMLADYYTSLEEVEQAAREAETSLDIGSVKNSFMKVLWQKIKRLTKI